MGWRPSVQSWTSRSRSTPPAGRSTGSRRSSETSCGWRSTRCATGRTSGRGRDRRGHRSREGAVWRRRPGIHQWRVGRSPEGERGPGVNQPDSLTALAEELEAVADKLRADAVDADEAADLVERCAETAARLGAEIDARARGAAESEGQERLL